MKKKTAHQDDNAGESRSFEQSLADLEEIVTKLEGGQLDLADSLTAYEHGVQRLKSCYGMLDDAERRIELVTSVAKDGSAETESFDETSTAESGSTAKQRSKRRTAQAAGKPSAGKPARQVDDPTSLF